MSVLLEQLLIFLLEGIYMPKDWTIYMELDMELDISKVFIRVHVELALLTKLLSSLEW